MAFIKLKSLLASLPTLSKAAVQDNFNAILDVLGTGANNGKLASGNFASRPFIDLGHLCEPNHWFPIQFVFPSITALSTAYEAAVAIPDATLRSNLMDGVSLARRAYFMGGEQQSGADYTLTNGVVQLQGDGWSHSFTLIDVPRFHSEYLGLLPVHTLTPGEVIRASVTVSSTTATLPLVNSVLTLYLVGSHMP